MIQFKKTGAVIFLTVMVMAVGCKKDYYTDTGLHTPNFNGNVLQYLQSKPGHHFFRPGRFLYQQDD